MKTADSEVGTGRTELATEVRIGMRPVPMGVSVVRVLISNVVLLATSVEVLGTAEVTGAKESEAAGDEVVAGEEAVAGDEVVTGDNVMVGNETVAGDEMVAGEEVVAEDEVASDEALVGSSVVEGEELRGVLVSDSTMVLLAEDGAGRSRSPMMELIGSRILLPVVVGAICCEVWTVS